MQMIFPVQTCTSSNEEHLNLCNSWFGVTEGHDWVPAVLGRCHKSLDWSVDRRLGLKKASDARPAAAFHTSR